MAQRQRDQQDDQAAHMRQISEELRRLVKSNSWLYLRTIANEILEPYKCGPAITGEGAEKWDSYSKLAWGFEALFARAQQLAGAGPTESNPPPPTIPTKKNANNRR